MVLIRYIDEAMHIKCAKQMHVNMSYIGGA